MPLSLVVHFSGPWWHTTKVMGHESHHDRDISPCCKDVHYDPYEAIQSLRDEYRVSFGLPFMGDLMNSIPQIWAACPPAIALAAGKNAVTSVMMRVIKHIHSQT